MTYGLSTTLDRPFDDTVTAVREALAGEGFGVVSEIDMQATLRTKLGVETDPYLILGACNPAYAHRSLQADPSIGLLLPCNVVIRRADTGTVVEMINPQMLVDVTDNLDMQPIAQAVSDKLAAAMHTLNSTA
ncbi:MAG TPA: DUF302 domain-containing protein [Ornithinibacter sp.]|jgi:uncharacterized protein (DUF302 family)|uniref:DUF302 domain-containing protein n=1 Tax=Ornithinibacter sp. TaxID=2862748 RepID=UPI002BBAE674|nr:DUF302 domain-containing protein [Ornithinibacter sp.]HNV40108.1 DUF302 domain-containing protein [Ornithinibacter sp.]HOB79014.1 DUF302 domain-containing protein [Ornithinibacter sp.]HPV89142.1 DUF302 domain-containing protein [Ornithinibacter sp.]HQA12719.1 DUF302 domain-containing protein [Ornithinibacter sp.]HQD67054.1 DUF302 domain-containing protein [Ornithinibacter sp.]